MLIPALDPPTTAKDLEDVHGMLVPGDYVWHNGNNLNLAGLPQGKIRFFLVDKSNSNASWNIPFTTPGMQKPAENIQFWYGGTRKLVLGPWVTGVIYAPNAEVSLPFNGQFTGAIVANRITGAGNNTYSFDKALLNARF
jgi:hypothetical protein